LSPFASATYNLQHANNSRQPASAAAKEDDMKSPQRIDENLIEDHDGIACVRREAGEDHWNGLDYQLGINRETVGSNVLSMNMATVPPGGVAAAHIHVGFEVGLYIVRGQVEHRFGPRLEQRLVNGAGDFIFIEPGVPHEVYNLSDSEPVVAIVARTSADQWDDIIPYDPASDI
jgi:uncharacterized RmlC-like cupin family protein